MTGAGIESRRLAIAALVRIDQEGAYANLVLPHLLERTSLSERDRGFVTELVYGATRMRRAVDFLADRFVERAEVDPSTRAALQIGAYQLHFLETPPHAAVDATVAAAPKRSRGFINAILRRIADSDVVWPSDAIRLSFPDWLLERLAVELGDRALPVLEAMNRPAVTHVRGDGYVQDLASQEVVRLLGRPKRALDLCAAPGGKATGIAAAGAWVVGADIQPHRVRLIVQAAATTGRSVVPLVADGLHPPFDTSSGFDAVLVDAPCSGLGSLRRRPDARWRIRSGDIDRLADLQFGLIEAAVPMLRPGGRLVYSVCTLTDAESIHVDAVVQRQLPELAALTEPFSFSDAGSPWEAFGRGGRLLPDRFDGDGMAAFVYRRES